MPQQLTSDFPPSGTTLPGKQGRVPQPRQGPRRKLVMSAALVLPGQPAIPFSAAKNSLPASAGSPSSHSSQGLDLAKVTSCPHCGHRCRQRDGTVRETSGRRCSGAEPWAVSRNWGPGRGRSRDKASPRGPLYHVASGASAAVPGVQYREVRGMTVTRVMSLCGTPGKDDVPRRAIGSAGSCP